MKLFLDTANISEVSKYFCTGLIDGVTSNHNAIVAVNRKPTDVYRELIQIGVPHITAELLGEATDIVREAEDLIDEFEGKLIIKVPCTRDGLTACRELKRKFPSVDVNVTLVFSAAQAILARKARADFVSVPVGMLDKNSIAGLEVVRSVVELCRGSGTSVIADCIQDVYKVTRAFYNGADVVSMPPYIFSKMYDHVLTREGVSEYTDF